MWKRFSSDMIIGEADLIAACIPLHTFSHKTKNKEFYNNATFRSRSGLFE